MDVPYEPKSRIIFLGKCIVDHISQMEIDGDLTLNTNEPTSYTNAHVVYSPGRDYDNEQMQELNVSVTENSGQIVLPARGKTGYFYDLLVCISRKFKPKECRDYDQLYYLRDQIEDEMCCICCEGYNFISYGDQRISSIDRNAAKKKKFLSYIPITYEFPKSNNCSSPEEDI